MLQGIDINPQPRLRRLTFCSFGGFPCGVYQAPGALLVAHTLFKRLENRSLYPQSFPFPPILQISRLKPREAKGLA